MKTFPFYTVLVFFMLQVTCQIQAQHTHEKLKTNTTLTVSNSFLTVDYNPGEKTVSVRITSSKKTVLKNMVLDAAPVSFKKTTIKNPVFGNGNAITIGKANGNTAQFVLYPSMPFLFVTNTVKNNSAEILDISKLNPLTFTIDLGKPANELKTLGTGGLLAPDKNPGSYVFLTAVDSSTRNGVVSGWLTNEKGSGVLFSEIKEGLVQIKAQIDYGHFRLPAGKSETAETLLIGYFDDARIGQELFADAIARNQKIILKPRTAVYCTWYSDKNGGAGTEESSIELAKYIHTNLKSYSLSVIQIDDQWQDGGQYNGPRRAFDRVSPKGGYPNGMERTASALNAEGLTAGIWWMPFARNHQDPEYLNRQDWFAYRTNGKPYETNWGGTSLDLTNPNVQKHISDMAQTLKKWGYTYFKMDGLWTGTVTEQVYINDGYKNDSMGNCKPLFDPSKTQIETFRNGLKIIRKAAGDDVFLSGCCASQNMRSFGASFGLVNSMRIGPDFNHDGESIRTGAIRASRLYFLNGRVWWNDPDPSMIRESGVSAADGSAQGIGNIVRAKLLPSFVAVSGQFFLSSDWLPDLPTDRIEIMKRTMASHNGIARPVDAFDKFLPEIWLATDLATGTERNVIGLFNWKTSLQPIGCSLKWAGLKEKTVYHVFDFWENKPLADIENAFSFDLQAESCRVLAVRAKTNHPVVVSTSQHVTQGMIDVLNEKWANNILSGTSKLIGGDEYEIRIAGLNDGAEWKLQNASILGNPSGITIEVLPQTELGWLRVLIKSKEDTTVKWQLNFN